MTSISDSDPLPVPPAANPPGRAPRPWSDIDVWIFDLDNTLYPADCNLFVQVDQRMSDFIAQLLGIPRDEARALQKRYFQEHGTTLAGLMHHHAIEPHDFLAMVHDIDYAPVSPNPKLDAALARLPGRKIVFTNGTVAHAHSVLDRLGIPHHFESVFDIVAAEYVPKPRPEPYDRFLAAHGIDPARAAMVEDMAKNLRHPHTLGMTTVWIRTDHPWSHAEEGADHIHHSADDIVSFLEDVLTGLKR